MLHLLVHKIRDSCKILLHVWYHDDGIAIGDSKEVARVLGITKEISPVLGLHRNIKKSMVFWPSYDSGKHCKDFFPYSHLDVNIMGET